MENLVIAGGGVKAYSSIGVLKYLEEKGISKNIKNILGVSSGSIIASLFALGCSYSRIIEIYDSINFVPYTVKYNNICTYYNIIFNKGIYDTKKFKIDVVEKVLYLACGDSEITFEQVLMRYGKFLVIPGSCLNRREQHFYHIITNRTMKIKDAITISCCIPLVFTPVKWKGDTLVDGGVIENYPIYFFNEVQLPSSKNKKILDLGEKLNPKTFGIKYIDKNTSRDSSLWVGNDATENFVEYIKSIFNTVLTSNERKYIRDGYWENTIAIDINCIKSLDSLHLEGSEKKELLELGYLAAVENLEKLNS